MENKNYTDALVQLDEFIKQRGEWITVLEDSIDKSIIDRTLPFDYKEKYVEWQQELLDLLQNQVNDASEYGRTIKNTKNDID